LTVTNGARYRDAKFAIRAFDVASRRKLIAVTSRPPQLFQD
jgi:hypothetical protein